MEYAWHKDAEQRWYRLAISPVRQDNDRGAVIMHVDITDRVEAEAIRLENAELLHRVLQSVDEGILVADHDGILIKWNPAAEKILGLEFQEHTQDWQQWLRPIEDDLVPALGSTQFPLVAALGGEVITDLELRVADADGLPLYISVNARPLRDPAGAIWGAVATLRDMTDRIAREIENTRISAAVHQTADAVIITDTHGVVEYVNPAFTHMYEYETPEAIGHPIDFLKHDEEPRETFQDLWASLKSGQTWNGRMVNRTKSGGRRVADITITPVRDHRGITRSYVASLRDVTDQESMEAQLRQSQKMEAIGVLAGGIAHDFNNILAAIDGYSRMALNRMSADTQEHADLGQVLRATERAKGLIRQILTFSRQTEARLVSLTLTDVVSESIGLMRATLPATIALQTDLAEEHIVVSADATQLQQVIVNLCTNAAHAMAPGGGTLTVTVGHARPDQFGAGTTVPDGNYAVISVSDTGCGIPPELHSRIFDPFFSTKDTDRGTGLGLSTVLGIVKGHGGEITMESELNSGTTFRIFLPILEEGAPARARAKKRNAVVRGHGERVLVVDDEEVIAKLTGRMLDGLGYKTQIFSRPEDALDAFRQAPDEFDVILTDLTMPNMTGDKLSEAIGALRPELPVIILSGFSEVNGSNQCRANAILAKPVSISALSQSMDRVLHNPKEKASDS
jgi:PAS domain S-box-containing protein